VKQRIKVYDYATRMGIGVSTVYRHIKAEKLETEMIDGVLYVLADEEELNAIETPFSAIAELKERIEQQQTEIEYLRQELTEARQITKQMQEDAASSQQRSDTIIMQLTRQLEKQTLMLEDMRNRSLWHRIKTVFVPSARGI
jgi:uncharacterized protein YbbC (DUF1343 family)